MAEELSHNEQVIASGQKIAMASSWIENVWWDWRTKTAYMETKEGSVYAYVGVPIDTVVRWVEYGSPGRFWWSFIAFVHGPSRRISKGNIPGRQRRSNVVRIVHRSP